MKSVYISYANEDLQTAKELQSILQNAGVTAIVVEHTTFNPNGDVAADMLQQIKTAETMVCIFSKFTNDSNFVSIELNAAVKREKKVFILNTDRTEIDKKNNFVLANSVTLTNRELNKAAQELLPLLAKGGSHA